MVEKRFEKLFGLVVFIVVTVVVVSNLYWVSKNQVVPFYDWAGHTNLATIYGKVTTGEFDNTAGFLALKISRYYPPFMYVVGGVLMAIFGYDFKMLQYFSVLLLPLACLFLYLYVKTLTKKNEIGLASVLFFVFSAQIWEQSRYFMLDLPLIVAMLGSLYFFEKSQKLNKLHWAILGIVFASFAQLTKWYAFIYLLVPLAFSLMPKIMEIRAKYVLRLFLITAIFLAICLPWYVVNYQELVNSSVLFSRPDFGDPQKLLSLQNILYYPVSLLNYQIISLFFVWLIISIAVIFDRKSNWKELRVVGLEVLVAYLVFTFVIGNKNPRYSMPVLPFVALIMAYGFEYLKTFSQKFFVIGTSAIFGLSLFFISSFGNNFANVLWQTNFLNGVDKVYLVDTSSQSVPYKWKGEMDVQRYIVEDLTKLTVIKRISILVVSDRPDLSTAGLEIFSLPSLFRTHFLTFNQVPLDKAFDLSGQDINKFLTSWKYVLIPAKSVGPVGQPNYNNMLLIYDLIMSGKIRDYSVVNTYVLEGGEEVYLLEYRPGANVLRVEIGSNQVKFVRREPLANIYIQFMSGDGNWFQAAINNGQDSFELNLNEIQKFRVDYPPSLIRYNLINTSWIYDGDKEFSFVEAETQ
jgi:hypothetical protein